MRIVIPIAVLIALFAFACGSSSSGNATPTADAGFDATSADAGAEEAGFDSGPLFEAGNPTTYPAFTPDIAQVTNFGGAVLSGVKVVTITWSTDTNASDFQKFDDGIASSEYWSGTSEYGLSVSPSSGDANHVVITDPAPSTWADSDIDSWLSDHVSAAPSNGWPVNDAQTVYMVYVPQTTQVTSQGEDACDLEEAYHTETFGTGIPHIVYGVVIEACSFGNVLLSATEGASHEILEASTDPHTQTDLAWTGFDELHYAYEVWNDGQDELADACETYDPLDQYYQPTGFPYYVQRYWSNESAASGKNPCVPNSYEPYFNAVPLGLETVSFKDNGRAVTAHAYHVPVGDTADLQIGLYSDMQTDAWNLTAYEGNGFDAPPAVAQVNLHLNKHSGVNGDIVILTVHVVSVPKTSPYTLVTVVSSVPNGVSRYLPLLIVSN